MMWPPAMATHMDRGLMLTSAAGSMSDRLEMAKRADETGYELLLFGEATATNVFMPLARFAHETEHVRLGPGIANVFSRSPAVLAISAARLDRMSDGRALLGLGTSTRPLVEGLHGMAFERPIARTSEYIDIVRMALRGERVEYDGEFFSPSGLRPGIEPVQSQLPIAVAANGPVNRRLTGAKADAWLPHLIPRSAMADAAETVHEGAREADRDPGEIDVHAYVPTCVHEDVGEARDHLRMHLVSYVGPAEAYRDILGRAGYEDEATAIHDEWQAGNREQAVERIPDDLVDDVGIAGPPAEARRRLEAWRDTGIDTLVFHFPPTVPTEVIETSIDSLAPE